MNEMARTLENLAEEFTAITRYGFAIDIDSRHDEWDRCIKEMGIHTAYRVIADTLCELYRKKYGEEFLFSNQCVAYEIEYHTDAYMTMRGYKGYIRNLSTWFFSKSQLIAHCKTIDIYTPDTANLKQRLMFRYKSGIRECYKGTEKDPFRRKRK